MNVREEHIQIRRSARIAVVGDGRTARELWVVCHGYAQLAARFVRGFEGIATAGRLIIAPEGLHRYYLDPPPAPAKSRRVGATWMTREDRETDIADYVAYLDQVIAYGREQMGISERIVMLGFSQGTAAVFRWAAFGQTRVDTLIAWAGEVPADVDLNRLKENLEHTRVIFARGSRDEMVSAHVVDAAIQRLGSAGIAVELREFDGGHELDAALLGQIAG